MTEQDQTLPIVYEFTVIKQPYRNEPKSGYTEKVYIISIPRGDGKLPTFIERCGRLEEITDSFAGGHKWNLSSGGKVDVRILSPKEAREFILPLQQPRPKKPNKTFHTSKIHSSLRYAFPFCQKNN